MITIVGVFMALLLFKIYFSISFYALGPISDKNAPLVTFNDFSKIQDLALRSQKPILVFLSTDYCYPCDKMKKNLFDNMELKGFINDNFVFYEYDEFAVYQNRQIVGHEFLNNRLPQILLCDAYGNVFGQISEIFEAEAIHIQLGNLLQASSKESKRKANAKTAEKLNINAEPEKFYGLQVDVVYDYYSARQLAVEYSYIWKKGVWIQQEPAGHYRIILGTFNALYKANFTKNLLYTWEGINGEIIELKMDGEIY